MSDEEKERKRLENKIHWAIIDYLFQWTWEGNKIIHQGSPAFEELTIFCVYNELRVKEAELAKKEGYFRKRAGVKAGVFDLNFTWPHRNAGFYDVKAPGFHLSTPQKRFAWAQERNGFPTAYGSSVAHLRDTLVSWGAKCRIHYAQEPDLRTEAEKRRDVESMWGAKKFLTVEDMKAGRINPAWKP